MRMTIIWILSVYSYTSASASFLIYIDSSQSNCNPTSLKTPCYVKVDIDIEHGSSNFALYTCPNLDSALEYITTTNIANSGNYSFVHICLPPGHFILKKYWLLNISFVLTGSNYGENNLPQSVVQCDYNDINPTTIASSANDLKYTLFFQNVQFVKFRFVHFESCPQPIRIEQSYNVSILNCEFKNFSEAVFDIYASAHIKITSSNFSDNTGTGSVLLPFRGNTGAVSISYFQNLKTNPTVSVNNCIFTNNKATISKRSILASNNSVLNGIYVGRGGAIGLLVYESSYNVTAIITDSTFVNNFASIFGGGVYVVISGDDTQHIVTIENCQFMNNIGTSGAGGIALALFSNAHHSFPTTGVIQDCYFSRNKGGFGGAINVIPSQIEGNVMAIENCTFEKNEASNSGGAISVAAQSLFESMDMFPKYNISNCTFKQNMCPDGIVNIAYIPFLLKRTNMFVSNYGSALQVIGCVVEIYDEVSFIENEAQDGGALYINSFGQIRIFPNATMKFERNKGQIGSSIVVTTSLRTLPSAYSGLRNNPLCFLLYGGTPIKSFSDISDVNFTFTDNSASEATAIFMHNARVCSSIGNPPYFDTVSILNWPFIHRSNNKMRNTSFIEASTTQINIYNNTVSSWPGKQVHISVELFDETNQSASEILQLEPANNNQQMTRYNINPGLVYQQSNQLPVTFATESSNNDPVISVLVRDFSNEIITSNFSINVTPCLAGYKLKHNSELGGLTCQCQNNLQYIRNCEDDQNTILLTDGHWGISQRYTKQHNNLVIYPCPPGYCRCSQDHESLGNNLCSFAYFNDDPDKQCTCDRKGYLCGDCRDGKGVSALLNRCVNCSDVYGLLIAALFIVDGVLIIALLYKEVHFSTLLFPTVFFINMVSYIGESYPTSYNQVGKYIYFINSLLSLYFPYDFCLYSGATPLAMYAFRYLPLCLTIIICSIGLLWLRYSFKRVKRFSWNSLWLLLTLQYSHVVYTSMTILHCPQVVNENGEHESRWFVQGTFSCFTGHHILLTLCAIFILLMCVLLIPLLGLVAGDKLTQRLRLINMAKCLKHPYKEKLAWWCVVELGRKFVFLLFLIPFPQNTFPPMFILMTTFTVYAYALPYKEMSVNIVELLFQLSLLLFLLLRSTRSIVDEFLKFPDHQHSDNDPKRCSNETGTGYLTWILFPFACLPLVVIMGIFSTKVTIRLWKFVCYKNAKISKDENTPTIVNTPTLVNTPTVAQNNFALEFTDHTVYFSVIPPDANK